MKRVFLIVLDKLWHRGSARMQRFQGMREATHCWQCPKVCILTCRIWRNWAYLLSTAQRSTVTGRALCRLHLWTNDGSSRKEKIRPSDIGRLRESYLKNRCRCIRKDFRKKSLRFLNRKQAERSSATGRIPVRRLSEITEMNT